VIGSDCDALSVCDLYNGRCQPILYDHWSTDEVAKQRHTAHAQVAPVYY
jgi:hypothetical protein